MLKKICNFLLTILLIVLLLVAVALIAPPMLGYQSMAVLSGSMEPNIAVGAIVYAKEVEPSELKVGDIITYRLSGDTRVTHRIKEIDTTQQCFITKGDANEVADATPVAFEQVIGKVDFYLPLLGYMSIYIKTPLGIVAICGVLFLMLLLNFLPDLFVDEKKSDTFEKSQNQKK